MADTNNNPTTTDPTPNPEILAVDPEAQKQNEAAAAAAAAFIREEIPTLGRIAGLDVRVEVGDGWTTDMETGDMTIDPKFFAERGYSAGHSVYATLHELWAHAREVLNDPKMAARQNRFSQKGEAEQIFNNILADIYGNKYMHCVLPALEGVAADLYDTKLFPSADGPGKPADYTTDPLHLQFLYKIMRDEMIPGSETTVRPEVSEAIQALRDYKGAGDIIKYLTDPKSKLSNTKRFESQLAIIYPVYLKLLEQSKKEEQDKKAKEKEGEGPQGDGPQGDGPEGESPERQGPQGDGPRTKRPPSDGPEGKKPQDKDPEDQDSEGKDGQLKKPDDPFKKAYEDYHKNKDPKPISDADMDAARKSAQDRARKKKQAEKPIDTQAELDKHLLKETGHGLATHNAYKQEVNEHLGSIDRMRDVFKSVIEQRVALVRGLGRQPHTEGDILDPNRLSQTVVDVMAGVEEPEAYLRYERKKGHTEVYGGTDYIFVFDKSGSMGNDDESGHKKSELAATCAMIMLEGLAAVQRDIERAEQENNMDLDLDIKTGLYLFGEGSTCIKPLGLGLSDTERLDSDQAIRAADDKSTDDYVALSEIADIPKASDRRRVVIVVTDGQSARPEYAEAAIKKLRDQGVLVYGVSIGADDATTLYAPFGKRVDDATKLPDVLQEFIEQTVS